MLAFRFTRQAARKFLLVQVNLLPLPAGYHSQHVQLDGRVQAGVSPEVCVQILLDIQQRSGVSRAIVKLLPVGVPARPDLSHHVGVHLAFHSWSSRLPAPVVIKPGTRTSQNGQHKQCLLISWMRTMTMSENCEGKLAHYCSYCWSSFPEMSQPFQYFVSACSR
jgi:hypothetical protein